MSARRRATGLATVAWNGREARLQGLAVDPERRRGGLGRALVAAAATEWQSVSYGLLYAVAETAGVIRKYRNDTLEPAGDFAQVPGIGATGLVFERV